MRIPIYQVDAFTSKAFGGNPAAVCPLDAWLPDDVMQSIGDENNLAETAFIVPEDGEFRIRWFTPRAEVDLCGHATLASAYVLFEYLDTKRSNVTFQSRSGPLRVRRTGDRLELDFPVLAPAKRDAVAAVSAALGKPPVQLLEASAYLAVYETERDVRSLAPDFAAVAAVHHHGVIVTAPGDDADFVSRFFAPRYGLNEDSVTGSAHCTLTPYWAARLGKTELHARQVSKRGGELWCALAGDRVKIAGHVAPYMAGAIEI